MRTALSICFVCTLLTPLQARANQANEATTQLASQVRTLKHLLGQSERDVQVIKRRIDGMQTGPRVLQGLGMALGGAAAMAGLFGFIARAFGASPSIPWAILGITGSVVMLGSSFGGLGWSISRATQAKQMYGARLHSLNQRVATLRQKLHLAKTALAQQRESSRVIKKFALGKGRNTGSDAGAIAMISVGIAGLAIGITMAGLYATNANNMGFLVGSTHGFGAGLGLGIGGLVWLTRRRAWRAKLPETFTHSDLHASVGDGQTRPTQGRNQPPTRMQGPIVGRFSFTMR